MPQALPSVSKSTDRGDRNASALNELERNERERNELGRQEEIVVGRQELGNEDDDFQSLSGGADEEVDELEMLYQDQLVAVADARRKTVDLGKRVRDARALARQDIDEGATERWQTAKVELLRAQTEFEEEVKIAEKYRAMKSQAQRERAGPEENSELIVKTPTHNTRIPKDLPKYNSMTDNLYEFLDRFEITLEANALEVDTNWKRILPICVDTTLADWLRRVLPCDMKWAEARKALATKLVHPAQQQALLRELRIMKPTATEGIRGFCDRYSRVFRESESIDGSAAVEQFLFNLPLEMQERVQMIRMSRSPDGVTPMPFNKLEEAMQMLVGLETWNTKPAKMASTDKSKFCSIHGYVGHSTGDCRKQKIGNLEKDSRQPAMPRIADAGQAQWVSPEVIQHRRESNLCLRCGGTGHLIKDCSIRPAKRPLRAANAQTVDPEAVLIEQVKD